MHPAYFDRYSSIAFRREDGVLEMRLHTRGGPALWGYWGGLHQELGNAFRDVADDADNRVVILTGTGDSFIAGYDPQTEMPPPMTPETWNTIMQEGCALLRSLMAIPVPMIAAVNGPAFIHAEIAALADIVLAADHAAFADKAHAIAGVVPGDGVHTVWPMLLGPNRARYFLLTGQEIAADEALRLGIVGEVVPLRDLAARAWDHARTFAARPPLSNRFTRAVLTKRLHALINDELEEGLALEGMAILARAAKD